MGVTFHDWANAFFAEEGDKVNRLVVRDVAFKDYLYNNGGKMTAQSFFERLKAFCKLNGYTLNPKQFLDKKGKIIHKVQRTMYDPKTNTWIDLPGAKETKELLYIQTVPEIPDDVSVSNVTQDGSGPKRYMPTDDFIIDPTQTEADFPI